MGLVGRLRVWVREERYKHRFRKRYREAVLTAKPGIHPLVVVLDHLRTQFNPGAIVRSADAFGARAVYVIGTDYFEPRPAMSSLYNVPIRFFHTFSDVHRELVAEGYSVFVLEPARNHETPEFLHSVAFPRNTALVVGHETLGVSFSPAAFGHVVCLSIAQYGVIPSLNANVAAAVAMYEYVRQHGKPVTR